MTYLITILGISLLIILHELGHYGVARACNMRVLTFSVGFGPVIAKKTFGETQWQLALIPLGGYVQIDGMGVEDHPDTQDPRRFNNKPNWQRALVIFAGPLMNWLLAAAFLAAVAATAGLQTFDRPILSGVSPNGPAASAGLKPGDQILAIDGVSVFSWQNFVDRVRKHPEEELVFTVQRNPDNAPIRVQVTPARSQEGFGRIGAAPQGQRHPSSLGDAIGNGLSHTWTLTKQYAGLVAGLITGRQEGELSGIPGIVKMVAAQAKNGWVSLSESLAWLSIGLCLLNLMPIPALDGGRLVFLGIEAIRRRPVDHRIEGWMHTIGFALLFGLMIFVSVRDLL